MPWFLCEIALIVPALLSHLKKMCRDNINVNDSKRIKIATPMGSVFVINKKHTQTHTFTNSHTHIHQLQQWKALCDLLIP